MKIREDAINKLIAHPPDPEQVGAFIRTLSSESPAIAALLLGADTSILHEREHDYLLFSATLVITLLDAAGIHTALNDEEAITATEDKNWELIQSSGGDFRNKLDPFFIDFQEEDLLAFIEDSLIDVEEDFLTEPGREFIFVKLKTLMDLYFF